VACLACSPDKEPVALDIQAADNFHWVGDIRAADNLRRHHQDIDRGTRCY
jgi:hypothetical protein